MNNKINTQVYAQKVELLLRLMPIEWVKVPVPDDPNNLFIAM